MPIRARSSRSCAATRSDRLDAAAAGATRRGQDEGDRLALGDLELGDRRQLAAVQLHRRTQDDHVGAGNRAPRPVRQPADPRNDRAVIKPQDELHRHAHAAGVAAHQAGDVGVVAARGHEVDERDGALVRVDAGLEDQ